MKPLASLQRFGTKCQTFILLERTSVSCIRIRQLIRHCTKLDREQAPASGVSRLRRFCALKLVFPLDLG